MPDIPEEEEPATSTRILFTFSDMITALLTFFVLLITFSGTSDDTRGPVRAGLLKGSRTPPMAPGAEGRSNLAGEELTLTVARMALKIWVCQ